MMIENVRKSFNEVAKKLNLDSTHIDLIINTLEVAKIKTTYDNIMLSIDKLSSSLSDSINTLYRDSEKLHYRDEYIKKLINYYEICKRSSHYQYHDSIDSIYNYLSCITTDYYKNIREDFENEMIETMKRIKINCDYYLKTPIDIFLYSVLSKYNIDIDDISWINKGIFREHAEVFYGYKAVDKSLEALDKVILTVLKNQSFEKIIEDFRKRKR